MSKLEMIKFTGSFLGNGGREIGNRRDAETIAEYEALREQGYVAADAEAEEVFCSEKA